MLIDDVITRIGARVSDLAGRVRGAAELSALVKNHALPNETPFAFVLPLGLRGGDDEAATGLFRQSVDDTIAVVLLVEAAGDEAGEKALPGIDTLVDAIIEAVCGWGPANAFGVFRLVRGSLLSLNAGTVIYQIDFAIQDQLRITP
jgi:hypothetical protein